MPERENKGPAGIPEFEHRFRILRFPPAGCKNEPYINCGKPAEACTNWRYMKKSFVHIQQPDGCSLSNSTEFMPALAVLGSPQIRWFAIDII
jgi:hypothetical protein